MAGKKQRAAGAITFPLRCRGYGRELVRRALLARNAKLQSWGFAALPAPGEIRRNWILPGYDSEAVDRVVAALASDAAAAGLRMVPFDVRAAARDPGRPLSRYGAEWKRYERSCEAGWERISDLPGVRLHLTKETITSAAAGILPTPDGAAWTLADRELRREPTSWDPPDTPKWMYAASGYQLVDPATSDIVLWVQWLHSAWSAGGYAVLPGSKRFFMFPVRGTNERNAVMTAVTESGSRTLCFRKIEMDVIEVVVSPDCDLTRDMLCLIACTGQWLYSFFRSS
jgi:hypothetical protein